MPEFQIRLLYDRKKEGNNYTKILKHNLNVLMHFDTKWPVILISKKKKHVFGCFLGVNNSWQVAIIYFSYLVLHYNSDLEKGSRHLCTTSEQARTEPGLHLLVIS